MAVDRQLAPGKERLDHGQPEGQVGHEVVVHHVDVHPVGGADARNLRLEVGEVGIQDARCDLDTHEIEAIRAA